MSGGHWPAWELWLTPQEWEGLGRDEAAVDLALGVLQDPVVSVVMATRVGQDGAEGALTTHSTLAIRSGLVVHLGQIRRRDEAAVRLAACDISALDQELTAAVPTLDASSRAAVAPTWRADPVAGAAARHPVRYPYLSFVAGLRATGLGPQVLHELALDARRAGGSAPDRVCAQLVHLARHWRGSLTAVVRDGDVAAALVSWVLASSGWFALDADGEGCLVVRPVVPGDLGAALGDRALDGAE